MKIILKEDIKNLGQKDDVVAVKNGYGRNFLIPTGKASLATESALKVLAENIKQSKYKQDKIKMIATEYAEKLDGTTIEEVIFPLDKIETIGLVPQKKKLIETPAK